MLKRIKAIFKQHYFSRDLPFEHCVYMIFFFETYVISIPSVITNMMLNKGLAGILLQWAYIAFCSVMLFMLPHIRLALQKPHLLFVSFVYIPFLFFQTAGYDGTALLFALLALYLLGFMFSGKVRALIIALSMAEYLICILLSYYYPYLVIPHGSPEDKLIDAMVAVLMSFIGLGLMTAYISKVFADNNKALAELSLRDALTGVYNRRMLGDFLQHELDVAREAGSCVYVLMLDIDHFKQTNDAYGHGFGDRVLLACTKTIQGIIRSCDMIVRYGGDEFVIILVPPLPIGPGEIARRIRVAIEGLTFEGGVAITVSIGLEESEPNDTIDTFLNRADQRLYEAKRGGRNQVVSGLVGEMPDSGQISFA